jgi:hypothetical protein
MLSPEIAKKEQTDKALNRPGGEMSESRYILERRGGAHFSTEAIRSAAEQSSGFTMAYTQETVVSALLTAVNQKRIPQDSDLLASVDILARQVHESQIKDGAIKVESQVGFAAVAAANGHG